MSATRIAMFAFNVSAVPAIITQSILVYVSVMLATLVATTSRPDLMFSLVFVSVLGAFNAVYAWSLFYRLHKEKIKKYAPRVIAVIAGLMTIIDKLAHWLGFAFLPKILR